MEMPVIYLINFWNAIISNSFDILIHKNESNNYVYSWQTRLLVIINIGYILYHISRESNFLELSFLQSYLEPNLLVGEIRARSKMQQKDKEGEREREK